MSPSRWSPLAILLSLFLVSVVAACVPAAGQPEAAPTSAPTAETPLALAAYPDGSTVATLPPYPWPTSSSEPTDVPEPTEGPTQTPPMHPLPPTPVVTPMPTAAPPFIPFPDGTTPQPFSLYWRKGDVIRAMRSDEAEPRLFLDPAEELGLYLPPPEAGIRVWGAASPDGRTMALVLAEEPRPVGSEDLPYPVHIYLLDQETRELRPLVRNGLDPVWSPDGRRLAYRSTETGGLWVVEVEAGATSEVYKVDRANEHLATDFSWSSDNRYIVLIDEVFRQSRDLVVVDAQGIEETRTLIASLTYWVYVPQWSPTTDQIAFVWMVGEGAEEWHLWLTNAAGTEQRQLTQGIDVLAGGGPPVWSPDGLWIAFGGAVANEGPMSQIDLWLIAPAGSDLKRLTYGQEGEVNDPSLNETAPRWSPDGTGLVFYKSASTVWSLSLPDGRTQMLFTGEDMYEAGIVVSK
jgi:Tol biopolymer transport system component